VRRGRAADSDGNPQIDVYTSERVLFFVSGIAFLTTVINATTCPLLVSFLGITALPHVQEQFLMKFTHQLLNHSAASEHPPDVIESLNHMLHHIDEEIHEKSVKIQSTPRALAHVAKRKSVRAASRASQQLKGDDSVCKKFEAARALFLSIPEADKAKLDHPAWSFQDLALDCEHMVPLVKNNPAAAEMCKVVNQTFMKIVHHNYSNQIRDGELRPAAPETDTLFTSIRFCLSPVGVDLVDFDFVNHSLSDAHGKPVQVTEEASLTSDVKKSYSKLGTSEVLPDKIRSTLRQAQKTAVHKGFLSRALHGHIKHLPKDNIRGCHSALDKIIRSSTFGVAIVSSILLNAIYVTVDELARNSSNEQSPVWLVIELTFCSFFTLEALVKIAHDPCGYFKDAWNKFDFALAILGIVGASVSTVAYVSEQEQSSGALTTVSSESRALRLAKVLRTTRFLRIFRLLHDQLSADRFVSQDLAVAMHKVQTLTSFVQAHVSAQKLLKKFFVGEWGQEPEVEIARCLLQSQASVHKALILIVSVQRTMDAHLLDELNHTKERKRIVEALQSFVVEAEREGAISSQEAHAITHPMHEEINQCLKTISKLDDGVIARGLSASSHSDTAAAHSSWHRPAEHPRPALDAQFASSKVGTLTSSSKSSSAVVIAADLWGEAPIQPHASEECPLDVREGSVSNLRDLDEIVPA